MYYLTTRIKYYQLHYMYFVRTVLDGRLLIFIRIYSTHI